MIIVFTTIHVLVEFAVIRNNHMEQFIIIRVYPLVYPKDQLVTKMNHVRVIVVCIIGHTTNTPAINFKKNK